MKFIQKIAITAAALALSGLSLADPVAPYFGNFGPATVPNDFGGNGIPTTAVASSSFLGGTLYLSVTQRYDAPAPTNDGKGTFTVQPGNSTHPNTFGNNDLALWNFDWEAPSNSTAGYTFKLFIDTNAAVGNDLSTYLSFNLGTAQGALPFFDSSNVGYFVNGFDYNAAGEYGFVLQAIQNNEIVTSASILVDVAAQEGQVPEPASLALVGIALAGVGFSARRRKA